LEWRAVRSRLYPPPEFELNLSESIKYIKVSIFSSFPSNSRVSEENSYHPEKTVPPDVSPDFLLGYRLASASDAEIQEALTNRPDDLARLRQIKTLVERVLPVIDRHRLNRNEKALSRIVPLRTVRSQHRITRVRLLKMQAELNAGTQRRNFAVSPSAQADSGREGSMSIITELLQQAPVRRRFTEQRQRQKLIVRRRTYVHKLPDRSIELDAWADRASASRDVNPDLVKAA
jgi:hypothetical protein